MNSVLKKILPNIGTALEIAFPPFGGAAAAIIQSVTGSDKPVTPDNVDQVIATAQAKDSEIMLKLKEADQKFQVDMAKLGIESSVQLETIAAADRASARGREIAVKDTTNRILAYFTVITFMLVIVRLTSRDIPGTTHDLLLVLIGVLVGAFKDVYGYYYGSSSGSAKKTDVILSGQMSAK